MPHRKKNKTEEAKEFVYEAFKEEVFNLSDPEEKDEYHTRMVRRVILFGSTADMVRYDEDKQAIMVTEVNPIDLLDLY